MQIMKKGIKETGPPEYSTLIKKETSKHNVSYPPDEEVIERLRSYRCNRQLCLRISKLPVYIDHLAVLVIYICCLYAILFGFMTGLLIIVLQLIVSQDQPYLTGLQTPLELQPGIYFDRDKVKCFIFHAKIYNLISVHKTIGNTIVSWLMAEMLSWLLFRCNVFR